MSRFLDQMLRPEAEDVQKNLPHAQYEVKRLSRALGEPVVLELRALSYTRAQELRDLTEDVELHILMAGCPELKDPALQDKFGGATPAETVKAMLLPGEIVELSRAVERLAGYRKSTIRELKAEVKKG